MDGYTELIWKEAINIIRMERMDWIPDLLIQFILNPLLSGRPFQKSVLYFAPKMWIYTDNVSSLNEDIADYWGNFDLELTWRADWGLQVETHTMPAKNITTFNLQLTYPLSNLWKPLGFYLYVDYWDGAGETILRYNERNRGFVMGIALSR